MTDQNPQREKCSWIKADGTRCGKFPMKGIKTCSKHGGRGLIKIQEMHAQNRRYKLQTKLTDEFEQQLADPSLMSLSEDVALARVILNKWIEHRGDNLGTTAEDLNTLTEIQDRIGKQIIRHDRIEFNRKNLPTQQKVIGWIEAVAEKMKEAADLFVKDPEERRELKAYVMNYVDTIGLPGLSG
jgi:hypothetical protein